MKGRDQFKDLAIDGRVNVQEIVCEVVEWMHPAQNRHQKLLLVNTVVNLRQPVKVGNLLTD